jgi:hypothetical protein
MIRLSYFTNIIYKINAPTGDMTRNLSSMRSLSLTVILLIGLTACILPAAAENAWLEINSEPSGAWACLDGWNCNNAPITFATDPNSYHTLTVYMDGYQMSTKTVYANGPSVTTGVTVALVQNTPETGSLDLDSSPTGADVWLDNRYYGETPLVIGSLSPGTHTMTLRKAGFEDLKQDVTITAGQVYRTNQGLVEYSQNPGVGSLQIDSTPGGAAIFLNNNYQGSTPVSGGVFDINQLTPGSYTLRLTLPDYQPSTQTVLVQNGIINDIHASLSPAAPGPQPDTTGQLTIRSNPSGANIYLDNAYKGITPISLENIPQGSHAVILKMNGYQDWQSSVNVAAGSSTDVSGMLPSGQQPNPTAPVPQPTKSPIAVSSIISAFGICGAAAILNRKSE